MKLHEEVRNLILIYKGNLEPVLSDVKIIVSDIFLLKSFLLSESFRGYQYNVVYLSVSHKDPKAERCTNRYWCLPLIALDINTRIKICQGLVFWEACYFT